MYQKSYFIKTIALFISLLSVTSVYSQTLTNSAYSRFGIGEYVFKGFAQNIALGGASAAFRSPSDINYGNPASQSALVLTTFKIGLSASYTQQQTSTETQISKNTNFAYISVGFPVTKWWGVAFGMFPYTGVGYNFTDTTSQVGQSIANNFVGKGGTNRVFLSNGFNPFRIFGDSSKVYKALGGFSLGFDANFMFGNITDQRYTSFLNADTSNYLQVYSENHYAIKGFSFNFGVQQEFIIKKKYSITLGASYGLKNNNTVKATELDTRYFKVINQTTTASNAIDTAYYAPNVAGVLTLPSQLKFGICFRKTLVWMFTADYSITNWNEYSLLGSSDYLHTSKTISAGVQYYPGETSNQGFFKHTMYRIGFKNSVEPFYINNTQIKQNAITFGTGFPLRTIASTLSLSFEIGQRGTINNDLVRERYILAHLGFTINDKWFNRRKFD